MEARYARLGSVRGLAALVVLLSHVAHVYALPGSFAKSWEVVFNSHGAVVLFFVLSGFVLGLSWQRFGSGLQALYRFYVRRVVRIMPTVWVATALAVVTLYLIAPIDSPMFSEWMAKWNQQPTLRQTILAFMVMDMAAIPPIWTIYIELVGSALLPLMAMLVIKDRRWAVGLIVLGAAVALLAPESSVIVSPIFYMVNFAMGLALTIVPFTLSRGKSLVAMCSSLLLLTIAIPAIAYLAGGNFVPTRELLGAGPTAVIEGVASMALIAAVLSYARSGGLLESKALLNLGEWSFSLYLIHFVILRIAANTINLGDVVGNTIIVGLVTLVGSLFAAWIMYSLVEKPSIRWGKALTGTRTIPRMPGVG